MRNGRVDRIFRNIALHPRIIIVAFVFGQRPALTLHLVGGLPSADDDFTHAPHGL